MVGKAAGVPVRHGQVFGGPDRLASAVRLMPSKAPAIADAADAYGELPAAPRDWRGNYGGVGVPDVSGPPWSAAEQS
jgi:hypothetical protein